MSSQTSYVWNRSQKAVEEESNRLADRLFREDLSVQIIKYDETYDMIRNSARRGMSRVSLINIYGHPAVSYALDAPAVNWRAEKASNEFHSDDLKQD